MTVVEQDEVESTAVPTNVWGKKCRLYLKMEDMWRSESLVAALVRYSGSASDSSHQMDWYDE